ncbi:helix-turn-helix transcriptional regulator [Nitrobacter sp.]|uniref:helix-turn-helix transcriptional regulator n=1 Tax=Nitrobacter sp. TaxID=29420 RepID=UPI003F64FB14
MSKQSLSQRKAAAYLGVSPSTLGAYVRAGRAPAHVNLHGIRRFEVADLDAWLNARRGGG